MAQPSEKPRFIGRFGNYDVRCASHLQWLRNIARNADVLKPKETILRARSLRQRCSEPSRTA
jgi:hypothetical protein